MTEDPVYLIVLNYGTEDQKFWNSKRWVSDASEATIYPPKMARSTYERVAGKAGHEQIGLIENYGLTSERVAMGAL